MSENILQDLKEIRKEIKDLKIEITRYKSFIGGILWTFMALTAALTFLYDWIRKLIEG